MECTNDVWECLRHNVFSHVAWRSSGGALEQPLHSGMVFVLSADRVGGWIPGQTKICSVGNPHGVQFPLGPIPDSSPANSE